MEKEILDIKLKHNNKLKWGTLYGMTSKKQHYRVIQFAWKDSTTVLFMSTVHNGELQVLRMRKRPKNASKAIQATWENSFEKELHVPDFINGYNHHMLNVDLAD
jgi:hypothetical protein